VDVKVVLETESLRILIEICSQANEIQRASKLVPAFAGAFRDTNNELHRHEKAGMSSEKRWRSNRDEQRYWKSYTRRGLIGEVVRANHHSTNSDSCKRKGKQRDEAQKTGLMNESGECISIPNTAEKNPNDTTLAIRGHWTLRNLIQKLRNFYANTGKQQQRQ
jgi:hypothetical protein